MTPEGGFQPTPVVLDASILIAIARGDTDVGFLVQGYAAAGQRVIVPALAVTGASLDFRSADAARTLKGTGDMDGVTVWPLADAKAALRLAGVIARTDLDAWDAHVAVIAHDEACPILTLDSAKWRGCSHDLEHPLYFTEIAEPGGD